MFNRHPLAWFESKVDQVVYRNDRPFQITNKKDAEYCHTLQEKGFKFSASPASHKPRVIVGGSTCVSCEG